MIEKSDFFRLISDLVERSLIDEVSAAPKPGLVDRDNNGAHKDMDINTFMASAKAIKPFFYRFVEYGFENASLAETDVFPPARSIGVDAEKAMYEATGGVNCHKGIIFSIGLMCLAIGRLAAVGESIDVDSVCESVKKHVKGVCSSDYSKLDSKPTTNGERVYGRYGATGPRGEAEAGFPTIRNVSYPLMKKYFDSGLSVNDCMVRVLLYLTSVLDDTNVLNRGGREGAEFVKKRSAELLNADFSAIREFDAQMIEKNLSPGGCADLLAATRFLYLTSEAGTV